MKTESRKFLLRFSEPPAARLATLAWLLVLATPMARAHVVPPEQFHPVVESYRRMTFLLNLNPVLWDEVKTDAAQIATGLELISPQRADHYRAAIEDAIA